MKNCRINSTHVSSMDRTKKEKGELKLMALQFRKEKISDKG
jgi:hypothetical protein